MNNYKIALGLIVLGLSITGCKTTITPSNPTTVQTDYWKQISADSMAVNLKIIASDELEGRRTGEPGQKKATEYIVDFYKKRNITPPAVSPEGYLQHVPAKFMRRAQMKLKDSENIMAFIEGSEKPEEVLVISAHYDHMGILLDQIYYGADDNGSGTVAVMELARVFKSLESQDIRPKRSVLFLHVTGEEFGLFGSKYYAQHPILPLENTIANINIDMIGRKSDKYKKEGDYIYVVGADRLSQDLHDISERANKLSVNLDLDYTYNDPQHPEQIYYRSDHYSFAEKNIPAMFYFNGTHADYHMPTDTYDKIEFELLQKRTQLAFATAWELLNADQRPQLNK
ncbi:M28 family peptidase [Myroides odoratimimus]|uniref:M28 family metallopeptidase n=1 Tax=Myroides odoratimimus TaxID=76832 RepID=UPI002578316C|nr:M28 family metallopeptidase [Myroides odoratimimus]MDM1442990.1 M28 family peptidase [Myroides odoratimimus]MDM1448492.1 M28 family peptidase [Myroides odoratimimus]MDM1453528.1 M28 family peptidase [Myroides odoratimimus]MDM1466846.1 M28 family peptidase [Myroides odoratimimus]MDM1469714.1 M28 family peptidase [Myroides odoratimimus]